MTEKCILKEDNLEKEKKIFDDDVKNCDWEREHLINNIADSRLKKIDELFGDADAVSRENDVETNWRSLIITACGVFITFLFMFYGEGYDNFPLSLISFILLLIILQIIKINHDKNRHMKHLKYRMIAETLRAQFYVSWAGINENVFDMLPWVIKHDIPVIEKLLSELPKIKTSNTKSFSIFCKNEREYHEESIEDYDGKLLETYEFVSDFAKIITFYSFSVALVFEIYLIIASPSGLDLNLIYFFIKLMMGLASVSALLVDGLFGNMSLDTKLEDHERMLKLYRPKCKEIYLASEKDKIAADALFKDLIREFLIQASTKYVYQSKNNLEFNLL